MTDLLLAGFETDPSGDSYDVDNPTKQTELLALSLRTCLYNLQAEGAVVTSLVTDADNTLITSLHDEMQAVFDDASNWQDAINAAVEANDLSELPVVPDPGDYEIIDVLLPLLPAILRGTVGLPAIIPLIAPYVVRLVLKGFITKIFDSDLKGSVEQIAEAVESLVEETHTATETTIEQYNSLCDAIHSLEEYKQIAIMRTAEIDKVIFSEPI
jgi:hypothetical protein